MERDTLSEYPVQILRSGMDLTSLLSADLPGQPAAPDLGEGMVPVRQLVTQMVSGITSNDLKSLKTSSRAILQHWGERFLSGVFL